MSGRINFFNNESSEKRHYEIEDEGYPQRLMDLNDGP